jgi:hypothetical protein
VIDAWVIKQKENFTDYCVHVESFNYFEDMAENLFGQSVNFFAFHLSGRRQSRAVMTSPSDAVCTLASSQAQNPKSRPKTIVEWVENKTPPISTLPNPTT